MPEITATEASRRLSALLDAVEHRGDSYTIIRHGRAVARIEPVHATNGAAVRELLRAAPDDPEWESELRALRALVGGRERDWPG